MKRALLTLVLLAACRREPVQPAMVHSQDAEKIEVVAPPKPVAIAKPVPPPQPSTTVDVPEEVTETWAQLPDEWTRTAGKSPLRRGDRLIVGTSEGLFKLTWWGKRNKLLSRTPIRAVRWWDERTLVFLDQQWTVRTFDVALDDERAVAVLPYSGRCATWRWYRDLANGLEFALDREADRVCLTLAFQDRCEGLPADVRRKKQMETSVAVGLKSQSIVRVCDGSCIETGSLESTPGLDDPDDSLDRRVPALIESEVPYRFEGINHHAGRIVRVRDGKDLTVAKVDLRSTTSCIWKSGPVSPSGRWQALICSETCNQISPFRQVFVLDQLHGSLHPVQKGAWETLPVTQGTIDPGFSADLLPGESAPSWLPHSDVLMAGEVVLIPGVGGFSPGVAAH